MAADHERIEQEQQIEHSIELCHSSRHMIALTNEMVEGSAKVIRESMALLKRTAHVLP